MLTTLAWAGCQCFAVAVLDSCLKIHPANTPLTPPLSVMRVRCERGSLKPRGHLPLGDFPEGVVVVFAAVARSPFRPSAIRTPRCEQNPGSSSPSSLIL